MIYKVVHNIEKCVGCKECVKACSRGHNGVSNCAILEVDGKFGYFSCLQCAKPNCVSACPVGALEKKKGKFLDKILDKPAPEGDHIFFYRDLCIGCRCCTEACPWGVPKFNPNTGKIEKCDLCFDRVKEGKLPYCVEACPEGALELKVVPPKPAKKKPAKTEAKGKKEETKSAEGAK